jgi:hypothetical protein
LRRATGLSWLFRCGRLASTRSISAPSRQATARPDVVVALGRTGEPMTRPARRTLNDTPAR